MSMQAVGPSWQASQIAAMGVQITPACPRRISLWCKATNGSGSVARQARMAWKIDAYAQPLRRNGEGSGRTRMAMRYFCHDGQAQTAAAGQLAGAPKALEGAR